jgi:hypothetical protein
MSDAPHVFLQWKGTDACLDFYCTCGEQWHFDGYFAKELTCGHCGQTWELPHTLTPEPVSPEAPLTLVFDVPVLAAERGRQFRVYWPRETLEGAKPGDIVTVADNDDGGKRLYYADLLKIEPGTDGGCWLLMQTRGPA